MSALRKAARIHDKITHSGAVLGQYAGAVVGALVGCVITLASDGVGVVTIIPLTVAGASLGKYLGETLLPAIECGEINQGCATVKYGPERRLAARVKHTVKCKGALATTLDKIDPIAPNLGIPSPAEVADAHTGEFIAEGAKTVWVENFEAARIADQTSMGGSISTAIDSILIGGPTFALVPRSEQSQDNALFEWGLWGLDWAGSLLGTGAAEKKAAGLILKAAGQISDATLGKRSPVSLGLKIAEAVVDGKPKEFIEGAKLLAKGVESSPEIAKNIREGELPLVEDEKAKDLPSTPADDRRREQRAG